MTLRCEPDSPDRPSQPRRAGRFKGELDFVGGRLVPKAGNFTSGKPDVKLTLGRLFKIENRPIYPQGVGRGCKGINPQQHTHIRPPTNPTTGWVRFCARADTKPRGQTMKPFTHPTRL